MSEDKNKKWIKNTNLTLSSLICWECNGVLEIRSCSNFHEGCGLFYCVCLTCKRMRNISWEEKVDKGNLKGSSDAN